MESRREADRVRAGRAARAALLRGAERRRGAGGRWARARAHPGARPERAVARVLVRRAVGALPAGGRPGVPPGPRALGRRRGRAPGRPAAASRRRHR